MKTLRTLLRSQRGDLLLDSMFGAVIIAIIMTTAGTIMMAAAGASTSTSAITSRSILLNTVLSDERPRLAAYTSGPAALVREVEGATASVSVWREDPAAGLTVLYAATAKPSNPDAPCAGPASTGDSRCLSSSVTITDTAVRAAAVPLSPGTDGALFDLTAPAGATELRYVLKVTGNPADSALVFRNRDIPGAAHTITVPAGTTGYFYGRLLVDAGARISLESTGAVLDPAATLIYEAPQ